MSDCGDDLYESMSAEIERLQAKVERLESEANRLAEIVHEAYETDHSSSFKDWLNVNGYRLGQSNGGLENE